jgi:hypothetical protein
MKKMVLLLSMQVFILSLSGQDDYLLLTRERNLRPSASTLEEVPAVIVYELIEDHLIKPKPAQRKIKEGMIIKVKTYAPGNTKVMGNLEILNDSMINVGSSSININNIRKISVRTTFSKVSGPIISGAGIAGTIFTTPLFLESLTLFSGNIFMVFGGLMVVPLAAGALMGCACAAIGGIIYFIKGNAYNTTGAWKNDSGKWQIKVVNNYSGPAP